jgi:molybdenum cofactor synthesis domain-containing protein
MISVVEAIRIVKEQTRPLPSDSVPLEVAVRRPLAEDITADSDLPPFNRAQMDGYAVRSEDVANVPVRLRIVGESVAGAGWHHELKPGEAVRIMTGAPVPVGADSVQQVELTSEFENGGRDAIPGNAGVSPALLANGSRYVEIQKPTSPGQFIVPRAAEITKGETVLRAGEPINAAMMAVLASFGYSTVKVGRRPRVAVLATGSELVPVDHQPAQDQIRDSNSFSIGAYAELAGAVVERLPLAGDDPELLKQVIADVAKRSDCLILSGGVSMGVYDFTKTALRELGAEIYFDRVALRPGKPTVFGRLKDTMVFGLPGNPVSVSVTFNLFARTAIRAMQGEVEPTLKKEFAVLARDAKGSVDRESYLPATLSTDEDGRLTVEPLKWGGSSDFVAFAHATALINLATGTRLIEAGAVVPIVRLPN